MNQSWLIRYGRIGVLLGNGYPLAILFGARMLRSHRTGGSSKEGQRGSYYEGQGPKGRQAENVRLV